MKLPPLTAVGVSVGLNVASAQPAIVETAFSRAELAAGVYFRFGTAFGQEAGRGVGRRRLGLGRLAMGAIRFFRQARDLLAAA